MERLLSIFTALAIVLLLAQCAPLWSPANFKKTVAAEAAHLDGSALQVETANGNIDIERGQDTQVYVSANIRATTQERLDAVSLRAERQADNCLRVWLDWPDGKLKNNEGASLTIRVPGASAIRAESSNGRIRVNGVGHSADLRTANGSIDVDAIAGDVRLHTSNGRIAARGVKGKADLQTSNGSINLSLDATASLPFQASTQNGPVSVDVGAAFQGEIRASTSNGSIRMHDGKSETTAQQSLSRIIGAGGERSCISTSNGSVSVRVRN